MKHLFFTLMLLIVGGWMRPLVAQTVEVTVDSTLETNCPNTADGAIYLTPVLGTPPFTFTWSNDATTEDLVNIAAGTYSVTITDANGDKDTLSDIDVFWTNLLPAVAVEGGVLTCGSPEIELNSIYSDQNTEILWSGPNGFTSTDSLPMVGETGNYLLEVTDTITGCAASATAVVTVDTIYPMATATGGIINCHADSVKLVASSTPTTVVFDWAGPNNFGTDEQNPTVGDAGDYILTVIDTLNGCSSTATAAVLSNFDVPTVSAGADFTINCLNLNFQLSGNFDQDLASGMWAGPGGFISASQNPTIAESGEYILTATDLTSGCSASDTVVVVIDTEAPGAAATGGAIDCVNISATISASSPTSGVSFEWTTNGGVFSNDAQTSVTLPGDYAVIVTNPVNGCTSTATALVADLSVPPVASAGGDGVLTCYLAFLVLDGSGSQEDNTTTIWTTADGHFDGFENTLFPSVDAAGTYVLTVLDTISHCSATDTVVVTENAPVEVDIIFTQNVACHGGSNGSATATATGGAGNYFYGWSSGAVTETATDLVAGTWQVTVVDADGCSAIASATISQPNELVLAIGAQNVSALLATDGKAWATPTGGTAPYAFAWQNGESTDTAFNLPAQPVAVNVTDANGCVASGFGNVQNPGCALSAIISKKDESCFGAADGSASVLVGNIAAPVTFLWSNGSTNDSISFLAPGNYVVEIADTAGCAAAYSLKIGGQELELTAGFIFEKNVGCPEFAEGSLTASVSGGTQPYQYAWSNDATTESLDGLSVGNYVVIITDAMGCTTEASTAITSADNTPPELALKNFTLLLDANGTATLTAGDIDDGSFDADCSIASWTLTPSVFDCSQIGSQTVTVTATDGSGNVQTGQTTITVEDKIAPKLTCPSSKMVAECHAEQTFSAPTVVDNCPGGSLTQLLGLPSGSVFPVGLTVNSFKFTDASGNEGVCSFIINVVKNATVTAATTDVLCFGNCNGTATATVTGGFEPHTFLWSNDSTAATVSGLCSANFSLTITDGDGCTQTTTASVGSPNLLTVNVLASQNPDCPNATTGSIELLAAGGTAPLNVAWSNAGTGFSQNNLTAGDYSATVTDANGCAASTAATLTGVDLFPPILSLKNATVELNAAGQAVMSGAFFDDGSLDNCGIASWTISPAAFDCDSLGMHQVTLTATDFGGNSTSGTAIVTIIDTKAPVLACNSPITVGACQASAVFYAQPIVFDNCPINTALIQLTVGLPTGAAFPTGVTTQVFSYTDASGNTGTCSFDVTVKEAATVSAVATPVTCPGSCDGSIVYTITGNSGPFNIPGPTTNLCAGVYSAMITDAFGCTTVVSTAVTAPPALELTVNSFVDETDGAGNGSISVTVTGGIAPYSYIWDLNGQPFASGSPVLTGLHAGDYHVLIIDGNGCNFNSQIITINNTVAATEPVWASGLRLVPNPATEAVRLIFSNEVDEKLTVRLFDAAGRLAETTQISGNEPMDISSLAAGIWQLEIGRADGSRVIRKLVVVR